MTAARDHCTYTIRVYAIDLCPAVHPVRVFADLIRVLSPSPVPVCEHPNRMDLMAGLRTDVDLSVPNRRCRVYSIINVQRPRQHEQYRYRIVYSRRVVQNLGEYSEIQVNIVPLSLLSCYYVRNRGCRQNYPCSIGKT